MWRIMSENGGCGLSASQIGLCIRMFVWKHDGFDQAIWNPFLDCVSGSAKLEEGCLSLPKVSVTKQRATSSILTGTGLNGRSLKFIGNEITTRIWQHEIDHLDGRLIIDGMSHEETILNRDAMRSLLKNSVA
jgi:peptide deformylase